MDYINRSFVSRVKWGNLGRLLAVAAAAILLLFGSQLGHVFSDPELPVKAGRPVKLTNSDSGAWTGHARSKEKPEVRYSMTRSEDAGHLLMTPIGPQGEERYGRETDDLQKSAVKTQNRPGARYSLHPSNTQPVTPRRSPQTREFTPG